MLFVTTATHERAKRALREAEYKLLKLQSEHTNLKRKWNDVVGQVNKGGGQAFLNGEIPHQRASFGKQQSTTTQFTDSELRSILQMIHPDKQNGSAISVTLAQKINQLRK